MNLRIRILRMINFDIICYSVIFAATLYLSIFVKSCDVLIFAFIYVIRISFKNTFNLEFQKLVKDKNLIFHVKMMCKINCYMVLKAVVRGKI